MAHPDRKGGGGLSLQTLAIASAASLTAAMATSRLFPPSTIYASAFTPVIVAAVSELLNRPADRITELRRQRRTMVLERHGVEPDESPGVPLLVEDPRRRIHPKVWIATGLTAFAIAVAVLTLPELIFGGSVATRHRTTFFGGGSPAQTQTQTTPATTDTGTSTTPSGGTPPPSDTGTSTTPSGVDLPPAP